MEIKKPEKHDYKTIVFYINRIIDNNIQLNSIGIRCINNRQKMEIKKPKKPKKPKNDSKNLGKISEKRSFQKGNIQKRIPESFQSPHHVAKTKPHKK